MNVPHSLVLMELPVMTSSMVTRAGEIVSVYLCVCVCVYVCLCVCVCVWVYV